MNSKKIKVSILVPCYNVEKYIKQCMDSVVNQTLKDIEIICINDGSKDHTLDILKEYAKKDARITIINKENSGYGHSMNLGLQQATGEYIGIVESDDFAELNMFETLYNLASSNNVDVVKSNFFGFKTGKNTLVKVIPTEDVNQVIKPINRQGIFWSMPCIWAAIYKRTFLTKNNINFLETPGASYQDTAFNLKVWAMADSAFLSDKAFLHYRQDNENSSVKSAGKVFCVCDEWNEIETYIKKVPPRYDELKFLLPRLKFASYLWNFERLAFPHNYHFLLKFSEEFHNHLISGVLCKGLFGRRLWKKAKLISKHPKLFILLYYIRSLKKCR